MSHRSILAYSDFRNLWLGQIISRIGDSCYFLGPMFVLKLLFNDDALVGYVGAVDALPYLLLGAVGGTLADRYDRRKILVLTDILGGVVLLLFLAAQVIYKEKMPVWPFFVFGPLMSIVRVPFMPAKNAIIPRLVPEEKLLKANSFSASTDQIGWFVGIALLGFAGFAFEKATGTQAAKGATNLLQVVTFLNAASFFVAAYFCSRVPSILPERTAGETAKDSVLQETLQGIKYSLSDKVIGLTMIAQLGLSLFVSPFFVVYMATNKAWFGESLWRLTVIEASFVVGMFAMSTYITVRQVKRPGLAYGTGIGIAGLSVIMMGFAKSLGITSVIGVWGIYVFWNLICGLAIGLVDPPMLTYLQLRVPDAYRGRVMSLRFLIWMAMSPVGMALGGVLLKACGIKMMHILMGAGFGASGAATMLSKEFRDSTIDPEALKQLETQAT